MFQTITCGRCHQTKQEPVNSTSDYKRLIDRAIEGKPLCSTCDSFLTQRLEFVKKRGEAYKGWWGIIGRFFVGVKAASEFDKLWAQANRARKQADAPANYNCRCTVAPMYEWKFKPDPRVRTKHQMASTVQGVDLSKFFVDGESIKDTLDRARQAEFAERSRESVKSELEALAAVVQTGMDQAAINGHDVTMELTYKRVGDVAKADGKIEVVGVRRVDEPGVAEFQPMSMAGTSAEEVSAAEKMFSSVDLNKPNGWHDCKTCGDQGEIGSGNFDPVDGSPDMIACSDCNHITKLDGLPKGQYTVSEEPNGPIYAKYDDVLLPFLGMMRLELVANSDKGDRAGWLNMTEADCLLEILYNVGKLQRGIRDGSVSDIREYSADVANLCMMMVDICDENFVPNKHFG